MLRSNFSGQRKKWVIFQLVCTIIHFFAIDFLCTMADGGASVYLDVMRW